MVVARRNSTRPAIVRRQRGFTYLGVLLAIALIGVGLTAASEVWVTTAYRERMIALEWAGAQFVQAIGSYYESSPGSAKAYPAALTDLLEDRRYLTMRRHLRTVYPNPFTNEPDWEAIRGPEGTARGVRVRLPEELGGAVKSFVYLPALQGGR